MSRDAYVLRIRSHDESAVPAGEPVSGFLASRRWAVTAAHCVSHLAEDDVVRMVSPGGGTVAGRIVRIAKGTDLALICVRGTLPWDVVVPSLARGMDNDGWVAPARPEHSPHRLKGSVLTAELRHQCAGGDEIDALELKVEQALPNYHGYSGGPVERVPRPSEEPGPPVVVGMLIEQSPNRSPSGAVPNVLIAVQAEFALAELDILEDARRLARENTRALQRIHGAEPVSVPRDFREQLTALGDELEDVVNRGLLSRRKARRLFHRVLDWTLRYLQAGSERDPTRL